MLGYSRYRASFVLRFLYGPPSFLVIFSRFFILSTLNTYIFQFLGAGQVAHKEAYLEQLQPMPKYLWTKWTVREQRHLSTCVTSMDGEFMIVDMTKMRVLSATRVSLSKQSTFFFRCNRLKKKSKTINEKYFLLWVDFVMLLIILLKFDVFDFDWLQLNLT